MKKQKKKYIIFVKVDGETVGFEFDKKKDRKEFLNEIKSPGLEYILGEG